jgi:capsular exopolysaccharide synthesis family protein
MTEPRASLVRRDSSGDAGESTGWLDVPLARPASELPDPANERLRELDLAHQAKLVVSPAMAPRSVEQYRRLAAWLHQAQVSRGIKTAMVASTFAGEGKSLTATNLALTLSESYRRRVLLVDADLRRPTLHDAFQIPNLAGISDWLWGNGGGKMPLVEITNHLTLLPGGRPNADPMSSLSSDRMQQVLRHASERFEWTIVDTPAISALPDARLLSAMVDTVVFVVATGRTPAAAAQRAVQEIGRDRIIGVVMNGGDAEVVDSRGRSSYYVQPPIRGALKEPE